LLLSTFGLASVLAAQTALPGLSPEEQAKAFAPVTDVPGLPRVLILGDSISIGYIPAVRAKLAGKANVHRPPENCGETARGLRSIDQWLGTGKWDVIHFNFGLHDIKYLDAAGKYVTPDKGKQVATLAEYEANLRALVTRLKKTGAKLIFATTTPVPSASSGRVEHDEVRYNQVARRVMEELGVAINDLHALAKARQEQLQLPHNVHFTAEGSVRLGTQVAERLQAALP
jgi:acyl-CoA thioesterase-1